MADVTVHEIVEGEFDVTVDGNAPLRVLLPPGVGVAGCDDTLFVTLAVRELIARYGPLPAVVDLAQLLAREPWLLPTVAGTLDAADGDTV